MDKTTYRALNTEERVSYLNLEMAAGKKLWKVCEEIGIADNVSTDFKKKGYVRNEEGLFIKHETQHPGQISLDDIPGATGPQDATESKEGTITPPVDNEPTENELVTPGRDIQEIKRVGRPPRSGSKPHKLTIEISQDVYKALMHYKIDEGIYVNGFIEELLKAAVPTEYFKPI